MSEKHYKFELKGTARDGQTWSTSGYFIGDFNDSFPAAMRASFLQLTDGSAVYGKPEQSCQGPYEITSITIEHVKQ